MSDSLAAIPAPEEMTEVSALANRGADLHGTYTTDITGASRDINFDIGAFEYIPAFQFARPSTDVSIGGWLNSAVPPDAVNLASYINETVAVDTSYIRSGAAPVLDTYVTGLTTIRPFTDGEVIIRVRTRSVV